MGLSVLFLLKQRPKIKCAGEQIRLHPSKPPHRFQKCYNNNCKYEHSDLPRIVFRSDRDWAWSDWIGIELDLAGGGCDLELDWIGCGLDWMGFGLYWPVGGGQNEIWTFSPRLRIFRFPLKVCKIRQQIAIMSRFTQVKKFSLTQWATP